MKLAIWKRGVTVAVCLGVAVLVSGCSGFWDAPETTSSTTLTSSYFYILDSAQIYGAYVDSGTLTALTDSPYTVTGTPYAMAITPDGTYAYVSTSSGIYYYSISSGVLTLQDVVYADTEALALAVDASGTWLLDASSAGYLIAIPISSGAYDTDRTVQTTALTSTAAINSIAVTPTESSTKDWVFVAEGSGGTDAFTFSYSSSTPITARTHIARHNTSSGSALSVAVDPTNRLLYIGEAQVFPSSSSDSGGLRVYKIGTSALTELSASPYASGGIGPHAILAEKAGSYVYVANWNGTSKGNVTGFTVTTTALTKISSVSSGKEPVGLAEDANGNFVLAVNGIGSTSLDGYYFDTSTSGKLDLGLTATTSTTGSSPITVVAIP